MILRINGDVLEYEEIDTLEAPSAYTNDTNNVVWRKEISFELDDGKKVSGFAGLMKKGSRSKSGFALFRRDRLIQGSHDKGYRPHEICRDRSSYTFLRLFGELNLEGFDVSFTKEGFKWDEVENDFINILKSELEREPVNLLKQAEAYRVRQPKYERLARVKGVTDNVATSITDPEHLEEITTVIKSKEISVEPPDLENRKLLHKKEFEIPFGKKTWTVKIELTDDEHNDNLIDYENVEVNKSIEVITFRLSLNHPFMINFTQSNNEDALEVAVRMAASIVLATKTAHLVGVTGVFTQLKNFNKIINTMSDYKN